MLIDLKKINFYFLTTGKQQNKRDHILRIFKNYKITEINPIIDIDRYQSGSIGNCRMIDQGLRDQKDIYKFEPFCLLEDDVSLYRELPDKIEVPDNADLLYIGISKWGTIRHKSRRAKHNGIIAYDVNNDLVRVFNMLCAHGILICSSTGAAAYQRCMMESYYLKRPWDISLARIQPYYNAYALKEPLVYQDKSYGGKELDSKFILTNYTKPPSNYLNHNCFPDIAIKTCSNFIMYEGPDANKNCYPENKIIRTINRIIDYLKKQIFIK